MRYRDKIEFLAKFLLYANAVSHGLSITITQISFILAFPYIVTKAFKQGLYKNFPMLIPFALWIGWIVLGSFFVDVRLFKQMFSWWHVLFFPFGYFTVRLGEKATRFWILFIVGSIIQSFCGIFQFVVAGAERAIGVSSNSLTYANGLALTVVLIMSWLFFNRGLSAKNRAVLVFTGVIILAGVFVSLSRMVIYGLIFVISLLVIFRYRLKGFIFVGVLGVFLVVLTINSPRFERLYNRGYTVIISDSTRFALWKGAVGIIKDYPIFGIGVHVFPKLIDHYTKGYPLDAKGHAHNAYLQMAINYGLPGLLFFLMVYGALAFRLYKSFRKTGNFWAFAGLIVLVMYMLEGLTENNFGDAEVTMYFWFMQGLIMGQVLEDNEKSGSWTSN